MYWVITMFCSDYLWKSDFCVFVRLQRRCRNVWWRWRRSCTALMTRSHTQKRWPNWPKSSTTVACSSHWWKTCRSSILRWGYGLFSFIFLFMIVIMGIITLSTCVHRVKRTFVRSSTTSCAGRSGPGAQRWNISALIRKFFSSYSKGERW